MMQTTDTMDIDIDEILMQSTAACREQFNNDRLLIPNPDDTFRNPVMPCPCTLNQARNDPWFVIDTMFRPGRNCYIQRSEVSGNNVRQQISYRQQCCYDDIG